MAVRQILRSFLFIVMMLIIILPASVRAQIHSSIDTLRLLADTVRTGSNVDVLVDMVNTFNVGGISFRITYDPWRLHLVSVSLLPRASMLSINGVDSTHQGVVRYFAAGPSPANDYIPPGRGLIAAIRFYVQPLAIEGPVPLVFIDSLPGDNSLSDNTGLHIYIPVLTPDTLMILGQTGIETEENVIPNFIGMANYPNPFNSSTVIAISAHLEDGAYLEIYDIMGRRINSLQLGSSGSGQYVAAWDGHDYLGREVSSGIYCYLLYLGGKPVASNRMILLR